MKSTITFKPKQLELFWYWINERHRIYLKKRNKKGWPWTDDKILQTYKFTNVYRQLDRVTIEWERRYANLLGRPKLPDADILFHCCMFRLFNWPTTYDSLYYGMSKWDLGKAIDILAARQEACAKIFTGAYIIPTGGRTDPKHQVICEALDEINTDKAELVAYIRRRPSMYRTCRVLQDYPTVGPFIAYEVACDLRHTRILHDAYDINSWANTGPGAARGVHRLIGGTADPPKRSVDYLECMRKLLSMRKRYVGKHLRHSNGWPFEIREIEHSLCEFDKYMRVKNKEGKPRAKYTPTVLPWE